MNEEQIIPADETPEVPPVLHAMVEPALAPAVETRPAYSLVDKHVLVLGLGISGLAMARWCANLGARVTVADTREAPPKLAELLSLGDAVRFEHAIWDTEHAEKWFQDSGVVWVLKSPGLAPTDIAPVAHAAAQRGLAVHGELDLFSQALKRLEDERAYAPKVLAITGTNGKTTVTSLTSQLLQRAGWTVATAGNIGPSLLDVLSEKLQDDVLPQVWVLELSSFQLDGVRDFEPTAATVLNVTQDHLDWHGDMKAYTDAKARVFGGSALMVLNRDDAAAMSMHAQPDLPGVKGKLKVVLRSATSFGLDVPTRSGDWGLESTSGMPWLVRAAVADETRKRRKDDEEELHVQRLMPADALRIQGRHNAANALAALALATSTGAPLGPMLYGLREYTGEPHRVQSVAIVGDVEYFDDSKGTNVGATVAAIEGLGADRKLLVILGGVGKEQDFSPLANPLSRHVRAVALIGRDANLIRSAITDSGVELLDATDMTDAVTKLSQLAQAGDAVLLSPACASFDMFDNYEHRANAFVSAVQDLAQERGEVV